MPTPRPGALAPPPMVARGSVGREPAAPKARPPMASSAGPAGTPLELAASLGQALLESGVGKAFVEKAARKAAPTAPRPVPPGPVAPGPVLRLQGEAASSSSRPPQQPSLPAEAVAAVERKKKGVEAEEAAPMDVDDAATTVPDEAASSAGEPDQTPLPQFDMHLDPSCSVGNVWDRALL